MSELREIAYRIDPVIWVREVLGIEPAAWQAKFLLAPLGASILALTARQVGKTTTAAWGIAHSMLFTPGSLSVIVCPAQRQSAEAVRRVKESLLKAGAKLKSDNVYGLELENGSRVLALPGSDDSIRGLTVDGWIIADEAARLTNDLIAAVRPMRARQPKCRFAMLSTAWSRTDPFWTAWTSDDPSWMRLQATADMEGVQFPEGFLEQERRALGEDDYKREYLGVPAGGHTSPFTWDLYERATQIHVPRVPPGRVFTPSDSMNYNQDDPKTWPGCKPLLIAHDVGRSQDRSTAVIGGNSPCGRRVLGIIEAEELPQGLFGSARANALAAVDHRCARNGLIIADFSFDPTYAEVLFEVFGARVIGLQIGRYGDGNSFERWPVKGGTVLVYTIGRSYLLDLLHSDMQSDLVRYADGPTMRRAYQQLVNLDKEFRESGVVYTCAPGHHDDLGISCAMLAWAARHPHLEVWLRNLQAALRPRRPRPKVSCAAWT